MQPFNRLVLAALVGGSAAAVLAQDPGPVALTFAFTGDSRLDPDFPKPMPVQNFLPPSLFTETGQTYNGPDTTYPWYFNVVQLKATLRDLAELKQPNFRYVFFTGDLVMGFGQGQAGAAKLKAQLAGFSKVLAAQPLGQIQTIALPGNHETTFKTFVNKKAISGADPDDTAAWQEWIKDNNLDPWGAQGGNGPHAGTTIWSGHLNNMKIKDDQSRMTYSFNSPDGSVHFVVLNTDMDSDVKSSEGYEELGLVALDWATEDINNAQKNPAIKHIFVLSHKPIIPPADFKGPGRYDAMDPDMGAALREVLVRDDKVRAMICSHCHLWHVDTLQSHLDTNVANLRPVQICAGNAGNSFESFWAPETEATAVWRDGETHGPFFGFTLVRVYQNGKVTFNSYQRPQPPKPMPVWAYYPKIGDDRALPRPQAVEIVNGQP